MEILNQKKEQAMQNWFFWNFFFLSEIIRSNVTPLKSVLTWSKINAQWFSFLQFHLCFEYYLRILLFVEQFVIPLETQATTSSTYADHVASRTVDGDIDQDISRCSHTNDLAHISEAWLRISLGKVYSIKSVKLWYSKYDMCIKMCA